jgi:hypothetical protein
MEFGPVGPCGSYGPASPASPPEATSFFLPEIDQALLPPCALPRRAGLPPPPKPWRTNQRSTPPLIHLLYMATRIPYARQGLAINDRHFPSITRQPPPSPLPYRTYEREMLPTVLTAPTRSLFLLSKSLSAAAAEFLFHCCFIAIARPLHRCPSPGEAREGTMCLPPYFAPLPVLVLIKH